MKIGIQGERGSACDAAAVQLTQWCLVEGGLEYLSTAERTLTALEEQSIDAAVLAFESPLGVPVPETSKALASHSPIAELAELESEVRHCIMTRRGARTAVRRIASHPIPLKKHMEYLSMRFPGYEPVEIEDTGLAARILSEGGFTDDTAVIAMAHAAEVFQLDIIDSSLPANDGYFTRFALVRKAFPSPAELKHLAERSPAGVPHFTELENALTGDEGDTAGLFYDDDARNTRYLVEVQRFVPNYHEMTACIRALAVAVQPRLILDAGPGAGTLALQILQQTDAELVGVDLSGDMVQWAASTLRPVASRVRLVTADLLSAVLPEACDVIITNLVLHNFRDEQKERLLGKFADSLTPRGHLLWGDTVRADSDEEQSLTDWFRWKWAFEHGADPVHIRRAFRKERRQDRPWTISQMEQTLRKQGYEDVQVEYAQLGMAVLSARKPA